MTRLARVLTQRLEATGLAAPERFAVTLDRARWFGGIGGRDAGDSPGPENGDGGLSGLAGAIGGAAAIGNLAIGVVGTGISGAAAAGGARNRAFELRQRQDSIDAETCVTRQRDALEPEIAARTLQARFDPSPSRTASSRSPAAEARWEARVTYAGVRSCGSGVVGLNMAMHWTATRGGQIVFEAFTRQVAGGPAAPSDVVPLKPSPCRRLAELCAPGGAALLMQDAAASMATQLETMIQAAR